MNLYGRFLNFSVRMAASAALSKTILYKAISIKTLPLETAGPNLLSRICMALLLVCLSGCSLWSSTSSTTANKPQDTLVFFYPAPSLFSPPSLDRGEPLPLSVTVQKDGQIIASLSPKQVSKHFFSPGKHSVTLQATLKDSNSGSISNDHAVVSLSMEEGESVFVQVGTINAAEPGGLLVTTQAKPANYDASSTESNKPAHSGEEKSLELEVNTATDNAKQEECKPNSIVTQKPPERVNHYYLLKSAVVAKTRAIADIGELHCLC